MLGTQVGTSLRTAVRCACMDARRLAVCSRTLHLRASRAEIHPEIIVLPRPRYCSALTSSVIINSATLPWPLRAAYVGTRLYATDSEQRPTSKKDSARSESLITRLLEEEQQQAKAVTVGERVIQAGKDTSYLVVICVGFGIAAILLYYVLGELFSGNSVQRLFSVALKRIKADEKCKVILGEPISAHGEMSGRNRRRNISHQEYVVDGVEYMRMQFYVSGSKQQAIAHLDLKKNSRGNYECRFLFLELSGYPGGTIIIEDNR